MKTANSFVAITSEGGLLPADFLAELLAPKSAIEGLEATAYSLAEGERISEQVNRSWNRLKGRWADFRKVIADKQPGESTTTETRDRWLQPIFQELGFGQRLPLIPAIEVDGRSYSVSHGWNHVPIHLVGSHVDLDRRTPGTTGASKASPHSLVQQVLNACDGRLWGIASNGLTFRLLRDNVALTRLSFVEWDLAAIFDGDLYSEFFLLWLVAHQSRFDAERPEQCWLEKWRKLAEDKGLRALEQLRPGVARAIEALGAGLVSHSANQRLRAKLSRGELTTQDFYRQVLRVVYRLLFLFVAEDRDLLHPPLAKDDPAGEAAALEARERYRDFYSVTRLRNLALHRAGTPHPDLWHVFQLVSQKLGGGDGCSALALPALGSFLWDASRSTPDLTDVVVSNRQFLTAVHALAFVQDGSVRRPIDYKNLGSEELGSVYEGLLELHPRINADTGQFELNIAAGNERKTTGSYYTPDSLVQCLLDSALEPVVDEAVRGKEGPAAAEAILKLKVCDPAVGSGHFLIAAAHRLAKRLAAARTGEGEPSPVATRTALRDVIGHCLYGVDINPMSAELCRVSLWLESLEPGKPLSFLDHHIQVGNSLLGTTPALLAKGIPDDAFTAIEGDVKTRVAQLKKQNKRERPDAGSGKRQLYLEEDRSTLRNLAADFSRLNTAPDSTLAEVAALQEQYTRLIGSSEYESTRLLADTWCATFVWKKDDSDLGKMCPTERDFRKVESHAAAGLLPHVRAEVERLRDQYQFFHWHLAFPDVFRLPGKVETPENEPTGWSGGFDVVLGNPPWEQNEIEETAWFSSIRPEIAVAPNDSERKNLIRELQTHDPGLYASFIDAKRVYDGVSHFASSGGRFPLCGRGRMNTASLFAELNRDLIRVAGAIGCIVPTGIATDDTTKHFFNDLLSRKAISSLFGFHNGEGLFPEVRPHQQFCLLTLRTSDAGIGAFAFGLSNAEQLRDEQRRYQLRPQDIALVNPNTQTCPVFTSRRDLSLTVAIFTRVPVLIREPHPSLNPWNASFKQGLFNMASDSKCFRTRKQLEEDGATFSGAHFSRGTECFVPLFDAKMAQQFNHRAADLGLSGHQFRKISKEQTSVEQLADPTFSPASVYWVPLDEVNSRLRNWTFQWFLGFKDITGTTSTSLAVFAIIPRVGVGHPFPLLFTAGSAADHVILAGNLNSLVIEYILRSKLQGLHLTFYYVKQLPILPPTAYSQPCPWAGPSPSAKTLQQFLLPRVLELTYTAWDLEAFGRDCGYAGPPFRWDEERRFRLRAELDAAFFHLYLPADCHGDWLLAPTWSNHAETPEDLARLKASFPTPRHAVDYILDNLPIVRRKDEEKHNGDYRTKRVILEIYDEMLTATRTGQPFETRLHPPPGPPSAGLPDWPHGASRPANWPSHIHEPRRG